MIARGGTWDTNLKVVARKTPRRAMPVLYKSLRKDPNPMGWVYESFCRSNRFLNRPAQRAWHQAGCH